MSSAAIKHVVCTIRGRPVSQKAIAMAIDICLEHNASLTFLMILEAEFMGQITSYRGALSHLYKRMEEMSEFVLLVLCDQVRQQGVTQVDYIIRSGNLRKQLSEFVSQTAADVMVIVRPPLGPDRTAFTAKEFDSFMLELEEIGKLHIIKVEPNPE